MLKVVPGRYEHVIQRKQKSPVRINRLPAGHQIYHLLWLRFAAALQADGLGQAEPSTRRSMYAC